MRPFMSAFELEHWAVNPPTLVAIRIWAPSGWTITLMADGSARIRHPTRTLVEPTAIPAGTFSIQRLGPRLEPFLEAGTPTPARPLSVHVFSESSQFSPFSTNEVDMIRGLFERARPWLTDEQRRIWQEQPPLPPRDDSLEGG